MRNLDEQLRLRVQAVCAKGANVLATIMHGSFDWTQPEASGAFRSAGLSLLEDMYGREHHNYIDFESRTRSNTPSDFKRAIAIVEVVREDVNLGWFSRTQGLIAADIFSDFLEMAGHLLDEGYKAPAAVVAGSSLESHLKRLCAKVGVETMYTNAMGDVVAKKADGLNAELSAANAYNKTEQKQVTAWLGIRNDAAHGEHEKVIREMVSIMIAGIRDFIARHPA